MVRRRYIPIDKHTPGKPTWGVKDTLMNLDDEVAQTVLDNGIPDGKQVYGYHNGKFYTFQYDNTGAYHGYPVPEIDIPTRVLKQMRDLKVI